MSAHAILFWIGFLIILVVVLRRLEEEITGKNIGIDLTCWLDCATVAGLGFYAEAAIFALAGR